MTAAPRPYTIEFYADPETGREPVLDWINDDLTPFQRRSIGLAMSEILEVNGINICDHRVRQEPRRWPLRVPPPPWIR